jgi:hypothetical protein
MDTPLGNKIATRFGALPNFFRLASGDPTIATNLWGFAQFGYLDNPLPSLFKERLFVYLSRFCDVRYCIARHVGFLPDWAIQPAIPLVRHKGWRIFCLCCGVPFLTVTECCRSSRSVLSLKVPSHPFLHPTALENRRYWPALLMSFFRPLTHRRRTGPWGARWERGGWST